MNTERHILIDGLNLARGSGGLVTYIVAHNVLKRVLETTISSSKIRLTVDILAAKRTAWTSKIMAL